MQPRPQRLNGFAKQRSITLPRPVLPLFKIKLLHHRISTKIVTALYRPLIFNYVVEGPWHSLDCMQASLSQMSEIILACLSSLTQASPAPSDGGAFGLSQSPSTSEHAQRDTQCRTARLGMKKLHRLHRLLPFPHNDMDSQPILWPASHIPSAMALDPQSPSNTSGVWTDHPG